MTPPLCHTHGVLAMPTIRPGAYWCPAGYHLVVGPYPPSTPLPKPPLANTLPHAS